MNSVLSIQFKMRPPICHISTSNSAQRQTHTIHTVPLDNIKIHTPQQVPPSKLTKPSHISARVLPEMDWASETVALQWAGKYMNICLHVAAVKEEKHRNHIMQYLGDEEMIDMIDE